MDKNKKVAIIGKNEYCDICKAYIVGNLYLHYILKHHKDKGK